jgi:hypothetical protein
MLALNMGIIAVGEGCGGKNPCVTDKDESNATPR